MEIVLRHVPELIARILLAEPLDHIEPGGVFRADFGPEDVDSLVLHSGEALAKYVRCLDGASKEYVQRLAETPDLAPIVCTVQVAEGDTDRFVGSFAIYDGWHRAAWRIRAEEGRPYPLVAEIIKTKRPLVQGVRRP
jgi:hypothetical protein